VILFRTATPVLCPSPEVIPEQMESVRLIKNLGIIAGLFQSHVVQVIASEADNNPTLQKFPVMKSPDGLRSKFHVNHFGPEANQIRIEIEILEHQHSESPSPFGEISERSREIEQKTAQ